MVLAVSRFLYKVSRVEYLEAFMDGRWHPTFPREIAREFIFLYERSETEAKMINFPSLRLSASHSSRSVSKAFSLRLQFIVDEI